MRFEGLESRALFAVVPVGFSDSAIVSNNPNSSLSELEIDPTGRVWIGMVNGDIGVIENDVLLTNQAYRLFAKSEGDQGLLGMRFDQNFDQNGYLYVYYTADDASPNNKLSRLQVDLTTGNTIVPGSEVVLLELPDLSLLGNPIAHMGGALNQLADGTLVIAIGDHLSTNSPQDLEQPFGKVLRLNSDGTPAVNNPFYDSVDGLNWEDYVWSYGIRSPYSGDLDPVTGRYFIGDVGSNLFEEINDSTTAGQNFGWPVAEGPANNQAYSDPYFAYGHDNTSCAITGGAFYNGVTEQFPIAYQGKYFYSDFCSGKITAIDQNDPEDIVEFASEILFPLSIDFAPDGSMYYIELGTQSIHKVQFTIDSPPEVVGHPSNALSTVGGNVSFSVSTAGTGPFTYQWQENAGIEFVNIIGATSSSLTVNNVAITQNGFQYRVVAMNAFGTDTSNFAILSVTTNTPPSPSITLVSPNPTYRAGDVIDFSGSAMDALDGLLPLTSLTWRVNLHHNVHSHTVISATSGISGGSFTIPFHGETDSDVWYRVELTAVNSTGLSTSVFVDILPELSDFVVETTAPGGNVYLDGQLFNVPVDRSGVVGMPRILEVSSSIRQESGEAIFAQWLDGESSSVRTITTPEVDTAYVALYGYTDSTLEYTYLSDLTPIGTPINGWGPYERDRNNGALAPGDGGRINVNGTRYTKGLGVHADSDLTFQLNGEYHRFLANVGFQFPALAAGDVVARIYGDGILLLETDPITDFQARALSVDVTAVRELRIVIDSNGAISFDSVNWADAKLAKVIPPTPQPVYLSDLTPLGLPINGWGPYERDMSVGGQSEGDGGTINLNGVLYTKGLGVHADSDIRFYLNSQYDRFISDIGLHALGHPGNVIFRVYGDATLLYESSEITVATPNSIDLDVSGFSELRLVVDANGIKNFDSAVWAGARLIPTPSPVPIYLSDLTPSGTPINGWGPYENDMSIGGPAPGDGGTININGYLYQKGLGVHADSDIRYRLNGEYERFLSNIGLHALGHAGNVIFRVYGDGNLLFDSGTVTVATPQTLSLDVSGVAELQLVVDENGSKSFDSAVWANARLIPSRNSFTMVSYLSDMTPTGTPINGWGPYEIDKSVGGLDANDGGTINLNGVLFDKGLGVHANSELRFALDGEYDRFYSGAGLHALGHAGEVVFRVFGDDVLLFDSGLVTVANPQSIDLDVTGVDELRLVVDSNGIVNFDSAVWAGARLTKLVTTNPNPDNVVGREVIVDGIKLRLLPLTSADATLDSHLTLDDAEAIADNLGPRPVEDTFEDWIRLGDLDLNGATNLLDWEILNTAWFAKNGTTLDINDFLSSASRISSDLESPFEIIELDTGTANSVVDLTWHNASDAADVNADGIVSPIDALIVINQLQRDTSISISTMEGGFKSSIFPDTNDDQFISPIDVLIVINGLREATVRDDRDLSILPNERSDSAITLDTNESPWIDTNVAIDESVLDSIAEDREARRRHWMRHGAPLSARST